MFFLRLIAKLSFSWLYRLSDVLCWLLYYVVKYRKKVVKENLAKAFPEKTPEEREKIAKDFYQNFCDVFLETLKILTITEKEIRERIKITNIDLYYRLLMREQPAFVMVGHTGCWEWVALIPALDYPTEVIYKPLSNKAFDKLMFEIRSRFGALPVPMKQTLRALVKRKEQPRFIGVVADQTPELIESAYWTTFLNQPTDFYTGTEKLAEQFGYRVYYFEMKRIKRGYYEMTLKPLTTDNFDDLPITELYARALEKTIRANPADWLWSHRRWKHASQVVANQAVIV